MDVERSYISKDKFLVSRPCKGQIPRGPDPTPREELTFIFSCSDRSTGWCRISAVSPSGSWSGCRPPALRTPRLRPYPPPTYPSYRVVYLALARRFRLYINKYRIMITIRHKSYPITFTLNFFIANTRCSTGRNDQNINFLY